MRLRTVGAVSALALFAGLGATALAQAPGPTQERERLQSPRQQMTPGQRQGAPGGQMTPDQPRRGEQPPATERRRGQVQQQRERTKREQAEQPEGRQLKGAEQPDRRRQKAEEPTRRDRQRAEEPERKDRERAAQPERRDRERAEQPDRRRQAERPDRPRVSERQRTAVVQRFRESGAIDRARVTGVDIDISVGARVPRERIRLAPVPTVIVEEVPAYRGHLFFVVRDEIVIVEPSTYVVVDVIRLDGAPGRAAQADGGRLTLTSEQREIVLSHIDMQPEVRLGIGDVSVGMSIPRTVQLRSFPQAVIEDVPELEGYRYFVFEDEVAIVDPDERRVVLTISG